MIRQTAVFIFITVMGLYAFKDWYKSLCALILMAGVMRHPDMPRTLFEIQGLTPWNILLVFVVLGFLSSKSSEGLTWDMPGKVTILLLIYFFIVFISSLRMMSDLSGIIDWALINHEEIPTTQSLISEYFINTIKWVIPGILIFYGCKSADRFIMTTVTIVGLYLIFAIQIIKWMPLGMIAGGEDLARRAGKILQNEIGINRDSLSMMMAGAFWAAFQLKNLAKTGFQSFCAVCTSLLIFLAQALTAGRAGYLAWLACGFVMGLVRYKKYLVLTPLLLILAIAVIPGMKERIFTGLEPEHVENVNEFERMYIYKGINFYRVTSGRIVAWPYVLEKIAEKPLLGYGREAMKRTGIASYLWLNFQESFPHPHNMYLQFLFDNGLVGFIPVIIFYLVVLKYSFSLFKKQDHPYFIVAGGMALSLTVAYLVGGLGSQYFYPVEESLGRWCAIFLMFRIYREYEKFSQTNQELFSYT